MISAHLQILVSALLKEERLVYPGGVGSRPSADVLIAVFAAALSVHSKCIQNIVTLF